MKNMYKLFAIYLICVCLNGYAQVPGTPYILPIGTCNGNGIILSNGSCSGTTISLTGCACISGTTLNDDVATTLGIEYDWSNWSPWMNGGSTRALIQVGGQCWYRYDAHLALPTPAYPLNGWTTSDVGAWGLPSSPTSSNGYLYQKSAAFAGASGSRIQGICATGFHIPSKCELNYLENIYGMSIANQNINVGWISPSLGLPGFNLNHSQVIFYDTSAGWNASLSQWWVADVSASVYMGSGGSIGRHEMPNSNPAEGGYVRCVAN